jgi:uncharacterized membrane protein
MSAVPLYIWFHIACGASAILLGAYVLFRPKGNRPHKALGRLWIALMLSTSIGSFFIQSKNHFSVIHLLSVVSLVAVMCGLIGARLRHLVLHRSAMVGAYIGLVIAGAFTLLPYRMLGQIFWDA